MNGRRFYDCIWMDSVMRRPAKQKDDEMGLGAVLLFVYICKWMGKIGSVISMPGCCTEE
jgi:hypothetical protein